MKIFVPNAVIIAYIPNISSYFCIFACKKKIKTEQIYGKQNETPGGSPRYPFMQ